ncbi:MAG TPA: hypothetical protein VGM60_12980 [Pseudonocardia sp.]
MRNNVSEPSLGNVIMFGTLAGAWLIFFLVSLAAYSPTPKWWSLAGLSGIGMVGCATFSVLLWRRHNRNKSTSR